MPAIEIESYVQVTINHIEQFIKNASYQELHQIDHALRRALSGAPQQISQTVGDQAKEEILDRLRPLSLEQLMYLERSL